MLVFMDLLVKEMWLDPGDLQSMPAVPASLTRPVLGAFSLSLPPACLIPHLQSLGSVRLVRRSPPTPASTTSSRWLTMPVHSPAISMPFPATSLSTTLRPGPFITKCATDFAVSSPRPMPPPRPHPLRPPPSSSAPLPATPPSPLRLTARWPLVEGPATPAAAAMEGLP